MFFSVGSLYREKLSTASTDIDDLLSTVKTDGVTGYFRVSFPYYAGVVFLKGGEVENALESVANGAIEPTAPEEVISRAGVEGGVIDVFEVFPELVTALQWTGRCNALCRDLRTDSSDLGKMVESLIARRHNGYIEFVLDDNVGSGLIHFLNGQVVACNFSMADGKTFEGTDILGRLVERAQAFGARFNVFAPEIVREHPAAATGPEARPAAGEGVPAPGTRTGREGVSAYRNEAAKGDIRREIVRLQVEITSLYQAIGEKRARIAKLQRKIEETGEQASGLETEIPSRGKIDKEERLARELSRLRSRVRRKS